MNRFVGFVGSSSRVVKVKIRFFTHSAAAADIK
jgi:hypothetical protein